MTRLYLINMNGKAYDRTEQILLSGKLYGDSSKTHSILTVITATHPSIDDWTRPETDPSALIKKYLKGV